MALPSSSPASQRRSWLTLRRRTLVLLREVRRLDAQWPTLVDDATRVLTSAVNIYLEKQLLLCDADVNRLPVECPDVSDVLERIVVKKDAAIRAQLDKLDKVLGAMMSDAVQSLQSYLDAARTDEAPEINTENLLRTCTLAWIVHRTADHVDGYAQDLAHKNQLRASVQLLINETDKHLPPLPSVTVMQPTPRELQVLLADWSNSPRIRDARVKDFQDIVDLELSMQPE
ncbi:hypothetical protein RI367_002441 [Sorochytrium milnesiophthora]